MIFQLVSLALLLLVSTSASADMLHATGFDAADDDVGTNELDTFDLQQRLSTGTYAAEDTDIRIQGTVKHDSSNGGEGFLPAGTTSSHWAALVDVTAGEQAYYEMCDNTVTDADDDLSWPCENTLFDTYDLQKLSVGLSVSVDTTPGAQRRFVEMAEAPSGHSGCALEVKTDRTLALYYDSTFIYDIAYPLLLESCTNNPYQACLDDTECAGDCTSRNWPGLVLTEDIIGASARCQVKINGRVIYTTALIAYAGVGTGLRNVRFGAVRQGTCSGGSEAGTACAVDGDCDGGGTCLTGTLKMYFDDLVLDDVDAGFGYTATMTPALPDASPNTWSEYACGTGSAHARCVDDYGVSPYTYSGSSALGAYFDYKQENFRTTNPDNLAALPASATISGVTLSLLGVTLSGGSTRWVDYQISVNGVTTGEQLKTAVIAVNIEHRLLDQASYIITPQRGSWGIDAVNGLGCLFKINPLTTGDVTKVGDVLMSIAVRRPPSPLPQTLLDHNKGDEDGLITVLLGGDSVLGGTKAVTCLGGPNAGTICNQSSFCWWDIEPTGYMDKPTGGCLDAYGDPDHARCQTCTGYRLDTSDGAGYPCTADTDCGTSSTCSVASACSSTWACSSNENVCCPSNDATGDAYCAGLGTCADTIGEGAFCVWACGDPALGGICPTTGIGFGDYLHMATGVDNVIRCSVGGENSYGLLTNRFAGLLDGTGTVGGCVTPFQGSGQCKCTSNAQCEVTSGGLCQGRCVGGSEPWSGCTGGDCAGSGTCDLSAKYCFASDNNQDKCMQAESCESSICDFPNPDYTLIQSSVNDVLYLFHAPNCEGTQYYGVSPNHPCNCGSPTACKSDLECQQTVHEDSKCIGRNFLSTTRMCNAAFELGFGACTVQRPGCHADDECGLFDGTGYPIAASGDCSQDSGDPQTIGTCKCNTDADCLGTYCWGGSNEGNSCTVASECPGGNCQITEGGNIYSLFGDGAGYRSYYCRETCVGGSSMGADCEVDGDCSGSTCGNGICFRSCLTDSNCGNASPRSCDTSATPDMCKGYCTCPSASRLCTTNDDCTFTESTGSWGLALGGTRYFNGYCDTTNLVCVGGNEPGTPCTVAGDCTGSGATCQSTCRCTGPNVCLPEIDEPFCEGGSEPGSACSVDSDCAGGGLCGICPAQHAQFISYERDPSHSALANYDAMQGIVDALGDGTPPHLTIFTIQQPDPSIFSIDACYSGSASLWAYAQWVDGVMLADKTRFPYVLEFRDAFTKAPHEVVYVDGVHTSQAGALIIANERVNPWVQALNTCSVKLCSGSWKPCSVDSDCTDGLCKGGSEPGSTCSIDGDCAGGGDCNAQTCTVSGPVQRPQKYCQHADDTWSSSTCDDDTPCSTLTDSCSAMPCTCACSSTLGVNTCTGSANAGEACASANACCVAEFGAGYTCSSGVCSGALVCPAAGDACNPE